MHHLKNKSEITLKSSSDNLRRMTSFVGITLINENIEDLIAENGDKQKTVDELEIKIY